MEKKLKKVYLTNSKIIQNSNLVYSLAEGIHKTKCKKKYQACGIKHEGCEFCLEYKNFKDDLIEYKCLCCNKN